MMIVVRLILVIFHVLMGVTLSAADQFIQLRAPQLTLVPLQPGPHSYSHGLHLTCTIPTDAPSDLSLGAFTQDKDGHWFQVTYPGPLVPGRHDYKLSFINGYMVSINHQAPWHHQWQSKQHQAGIFFSSAQKNDSTIVIHSLHSFTEPHAGHSHTLQGANWDACTMTTGQRWRWWCLSPQLTNPYDYREHQLYADITDPNGISRRYHGFYHQAFDEMAQRATGPSRFEMRFRPTDAGIYSVQIRHKGQTIQQLTLNVDGEPFNHYVRVDPVDARFFSLSDGSFYWPTGVNLHSLNTTRSSRYLGIQALIDEGLTSYETLFDHYATAGCDLVEIWMSNWNVALEWRADWPHYQGIGRYNDKHAQRIDHLLDMAWRRGLRILLVINNHGQASIRTNSEWDDNPLNRYKVQPQPVPFNTPGPIIHAADMFTNEQVYDYQEQLRHYLIARYSDHPALMGWKLWTEINLTAGKNRELRQWHQQACRRWHELDPYQHPCTTHWSGNYRTPHASIASLPELDFLSINAYHARHQQQGTSLLKLLVDGTHPEQGLGRHGKAIMVTEFGGDWDAGPKAQLQAEYSYANWASVISGYAAGPMLWWYDWPIEDGLIHPYRGIKAFLQGEDLRTSTESSSRSIKLSYRGTIAPLHCYGWVRKGRLLGYIANDQWARYGNAAPQHRNTQLRISPYARSGRMRVEYWDPDRGKKISERTWTHQAGPLELKVPQWRKHLGFKLIRLSTEDPE